MSGDQPALVSGVRVPAAQRGPGDEGVGRRDRWAAGVAAWCGDGNGPLNGWVGAQARWKGGSIGRQRAVQCAVQRAVCSCSAQCAAVGRQLVAGHVEPMAGRATAGVFARQLGRRERPQRAWESRTERHGRRACRRAVDLRCDLKRRRRARREPGDTKQTVPRSGALALWHSGALGQQSHCSTSARGLAGAVGGCW